MQLSCKKHKQLFIGAFGNKYSKGNQFLIPFCLMANLGTEFPKGLLLVHKSIAQLRTLRCNDFDSELSFAIKMPNHIFVGLLYRKRCGVSVWAFFISIKFATTLLASLVGGFYLPANFSVSDGSISCGEIPVINDVCLPQPFFSLGQGDVLAVGMGVTQARVEHEELAYGL